jgi:hypothetical protein
VSKSFTATGIALAAQEGLLGLHDRVLSHFAELAPAEPAAQMKEMRIRDLLRMSSGHQNDANPVIKADASGAWVRAFLATEVENKPGTRWVYNSACSYVLSAIVQKVSGASLAEFLRPRLFEPLGIEPPLWGASPEGVSLGDGGITLRTEDLAKFGLLYLQRGSWNGRRILSERWVEEATSLQTSTGGDPDGNWDAGYGYQFWRNKAAGYRADGAFGQFCFVLPEHDAVLAVTSGTGDMGGVMDAVWEHLLPALGERERPDDPSTRARLTSKLESLALPCQSGAPSRPTADEVSGRKYVLDDNEMGLRSVVLDLSEPEPTLRLEDADGAHVIRCGVGRWLRGKTGYQKRISNAFDHPAQGVAASCGWIDEQTFVARLCFHEPPYTLSLRFGFEGDRLLLDVDHNLRWGETRRPRVVGKR